MRISPFAEMSFQCVQAYILPIQQSDILTLLLVVINKMEWIYIVQDGICTCKNKPNYEYFNVSVILGSKSADNRREVMVWDRQEALHIRTIV